MGEGAVLGVVQPVVSGCAGGVGSVLVGHPFETLRTRMQTTGGQSPGAMLRSSAPGYRSVARQVLTELGPAALYRGVLPPLLTSGCISMCIWTSFEAIQRSLHGHDAPGVASLGTGLV